MIAAGASSTPMMTRVFDACSSHRARKTGIRPTRIRRCHRGAFTTSNAQGRDGTRTSLRGLRRDALFQFIERAQDHPQMG